MTSHGHVLRDMICAESDQRLILLYSYTEHEGLDTRTLLLYSTRKKRVNVNMGIMILK